MPKPTFNTPAGQTIARELMISYLELSGGKLAPLGKRVEDSSIDMDWGENTIQDILGNAYTTQKKPVMTQSFDGLPLDSGDEAAKEIWELSVYEQNAQALTNMPVVVGHWYTDADGAPAGSWAERYDACSVRVTSLGGEGGGNLTMPTEVTYGGERTLGSISKTGSTVTFTADGE